MGAAASRPATTRMREFIPSPSLFDDETARATVLRARSMQRQAPCRRPPRDGPLQVADIQGFAIPRTHRNRPVLTTPTGIQDCEWQFLRADENAGVREPSWPSLARGRSGGLRNAF